MPDVGSSRTTTSEPPIRDMPTLCVYRLCVCVCVCVCVCMCRWVSWTSIAKQSTTHLAIPRQSGSHMHSHLCHLATCTSCFWECAVYTAVSVKQQCTIMWTSSELKEVGCRLGDRRGEGFDVTFASYYPQGRLLPVHKCCFHGLYTCLKHNTWHQDFTRLPFTEASNCITVHYFKLENSVNIFPNQDHMESILYISKRFWLTMFREEWARTLVTPRRKITSLSSEVHYRYRQLHAPDHRSKHTCMYIPCDQLPWAYTSNPLGANNSSGKSFSGVCK